MSTPAASPTNDGQDPATEQVGGTYEFTAPMNRYVIDTAQKKQEEGPLGCPKKYTNKGKVHGFDLSLLSWSTAGT